MRESNGCGGVGGTLTAWGCAVGAPRAVTARTAAAMAVVNCMLALFLFDLFVQKVGMSNVSRCCSTIKFK